MVLRLSARVFIGFFGQTVHHEGTRVRRLDIRWNVCVLKREPQRALKELYSPKAGQTPAQVVSFGETTAVAVLLSHEKRKSNFFGRRMKNL